jgi:ATP-dependent helicase HrpB
LDEIHATETNPEYALLFDAILCIRKHRQVRVVVASANYNVEMVAALNDIGGKWIVCRKRPFDVTEYTMTVPFPENAISAAKHLALAQFKSGNTVLRFLSGKAEIESMSFSFLAAALDKEQVSPFHRDLEEFELDKVRNPANYPRIILASSLAETSLTLADVDLVIDLGLSRILLDEHEVIKVEDHASSVASKEQRRGRAGRVKKGSFVFLVVEESNLPPARYS